MFVNLKGILQNLKRYTHLFEERLNFYHSVDFQEVEYINHKKISKLLSNNYFWKNHKFKEIPIINKQFAIDNWNEIYNSKEKVEVLNTSGTTGQGLVYPVSGEFLANQWAVFWKFRNIHGLTKDSWCAYISGVQLFANNENRSRYGLKSYSTKQVIFSQFNLSPLTVLSFINQIKINNKIKWLHGYPSTLKYFADLIEENGLIDSVKSLKLEIITTSSEMLFAFQKDKIEHVFGCKVRQLYGLTEGVVNIFECEMDSLHIDESYSYTELISTSIENQYRIIGTSYSNSAFPLFRYDTGDIAIVKNINSKCLCGRNSRTIDQVLGREEDYLILSDGRKIGRLDHLFKGMQTIKEAQIYQKIKGSAIIRIVKSNSFTMMDENRLKESIKEKLGNEFHYKLEYLDKIKRTSTGKVKFVISKL